jgi:hypothetical protein
MLPDLTVVSKIGIQKSFQEALSEALSRLVKPEDPAPEKIVVREWPQSNMDLHILFSPEGAQVQAGKVFAGLKIDEWTEFVPNDRETTAVGFHYESPQAEAPQAILVAVPPRYGTAEWSRDDLAGVVAGTIDLMRVRAVTSDMVAGDALGDRLPAMYFGPTTDGKTVFPYSNLVLFDGLIRGGFHYILRETD